MKNIIAITLTVLSVLLIGFLVYTFAPKGKMLTAYLPQTFETARTLSLYQADATPETHTIYIGAKEGEETPFEVTSAMGHYVDTDNKLALTLWVEDLKDSDYENYKAKAWERYSAPERQVEGPSESVTISEKEVFLSFRTINETDDTSKMITMGGGYVFFPEESIVVAYTLYNPRLSACEDLKNAETCLFNKDQPLPSKEDNKKIAEQIIATYNNFK
jgi:hypothetical protein